MVLLRLLSVWTTNKIEVYPKKKKIEVYLIYTLLLMSFNFLIFIAVKSNILMS